MPAMGSCVAFLEGNNYIIQADHRALGTLFYPIVLYEKCVISGVTAIFSYRNDPYVPLCYVKLF